MTDNQIIKALECCVEFKCENCPLDDNSDFACMEILMKDALDLINRQKAEITEKDEILNAQADKIFLLERALKDKTTEIERLQGRVEATEISKQKLLACFKYAKTEAIKSFWGKLITKRIAVHSYNNTEDKPITKFVIEISEGDNLVKEMTEVQE